MRLGELERRVMEILWAQYGSLVTARQVGEELPGYAYTTVLTVLERLERKGMVRRVRGGRAHLYAAVASRESYVAALMHEALGAATDRDAALVHFARTVSDTEAVVLRDALTELSSREPRPERQ